MRLVEYMHIAGTIIGFTMGIPAITKNYENRNKTGVNNPLNELSIATLALLTFAGFGRLPNIFRGLLKAIKLNEKESIRRFILISFGTIFVGLVFYINLILVAIYRDEKTKEEKKTKHISQILVAVLTLILVFDIGYLIHGLFS